MQTIFDFSLQTSLNTGNQSFTLNAVCQSNAACLAITGASGSGKSLTLRLLAGLDKPQSGHIRIAGETYVDTAKGVISAPQQRHVGLMFQDYALFPHLTVAQNIAFGLHHGLSQPTKKPCEQTQIWLEKMQLTHLTDRYPHQISGGQKQRTALARACIVRPKWLLLDEPFSALDSNLRDEMRSLVAELQRELNVPLLLVSHDTADTDALADEVWHMEQGVLSRV